MRKIRKGSIAIYVLLIAAVIALSIYLIFYFVNSNSLDECKEMFRENTHSETSNFILADSVETSDETFYAYMPDITNTDVSEMYLIHSVDFLCFESKSRFLNYANYAESLYPVGFSLFNFKDKDDYDKTAFFVYSSNKKNITKITCTFTYQNEKISYDFMCNENEAFTEHVILDNNEMKLESLISYDRTGDVVYSYSK